MIYNLCKSIFIATAPLSKLCANLLVRIADSGTSLNCLYILRAILFSRTIGAGNGPCCKALFLLSQIFHFHIRDFFLSLCGICT